MSTARFVLPKPDLKVVEAEILQIKTAILRYTHPLEIYLIGSFVSGAFDAESDLDFLVVYTTREEAKGAYSSILNNLLDRKFPLDLICLPSEDFEKKKAMGGISFEAFHHGKLLFKRGEE